MAVGHAHRRNRRIDVVDAGFRGLDAGCRGQAGRCVALHVDRDIHGLLEPADELEGDVGAQQSRHVLDADGVSAHVLDALAQIDPQIDRVHGTHRVRNSALGMLADLDRGLDRSLQIPEVVQRVENTEDIDAVDRAALDEFLDQVVGVMPVAQDILAAKQHLLRRIGHGGFQTADALPRILAEIANAGVERRPTP